MHILTGYYRNEQGLLERARLMVEPSAVNGNFRDVETGETYKAQEYVVTNLTAIEIISEHTNTDVPYPAFEPDAGECERIGMPVARAKV